MATVKQILEDEDLIGRIIDEVHKEFYGEDDTIMALIVSITTRLVEGSKAESKNLVLSEMSGAGKDRLVSAICKVMLEDEVSYFHRNKLTPEVFTYWHTNEEDWNWNTKVIHIEDPTTDLMNSPGFKTMASGKKSSTVVKEQKAKDLHVNGKPNLILTSYEGCMDIEGMRRYPFIHMNTSRELTRKVISKVCEKYTGKKQIDVDTNLVKALQQLKPYDVIIPFATKLIDLFPDNLLMRTYTSRFLDYISSSAVLHQYQREIDSNGRLIATWTDYELARIAFIKTISNVALISLSRDQQTLLEILSMAGRPMFIMELLERLPKPKSWIYRNCGILKKYNLIMQGSCYNEDINRHSTTFEIIEDNPNSYVKPTQFLPLSYTISGVYKERAFQFPIFLRRMRDIDKNRLDKIKLYEKYYSLQESRKEEEYKEKSSRTEIGNKQERVGNKEVSKFIISSSTTTNVKCLFNGETKMEEDELDSYTEDQKLAINLFQKHNRGEWTPEDKAKWIALRDETLRQTIS